jgi:hypothetical protein
MTLGWSTVTTALEDYELASARLDWVRMSSCFDLPAQREALDWHFACREAAFAALPADEAPTTTRKQAM